MTNKAKKLKLSDFFSVPAAEKGRRVPLSLPDGTPTDFYLVVIGGEAPAARKALTDAVRALRAIPETTTADEQDKVRDEIILTQRCALVVGGKLPEGFSLEAVRQLFSNNPGVAGLVEQMSSDRTLFYAPEPR